MAEVIDNMNHEQHIPNGKIENRAAKYWVDQNQWRLDDMLTVFTDRDGCIDGHHLAEYYKDALFENGELRLSLSELTGNRFKGIIPDKIVLFKEDDLYRLVGIDKQQF